MWRWCRVYFGGIENRFENWCWPSFVIRARKLVSFSARPTGVGSYVYVKKLDELVGEERVYCREFCFILSWNKERFFFFSFSLENCSPCFERRGRISRASFNDLLLIGSTNISNAMLKFLSRFWSSLLSIDSIFFTKVSTGSRLIYYIDTQFLRFPGKKCNTNIVNISSTAWIMNRCSLLHHRSWLSFHNVLDAATWIMHYYKLHRGNNRVMEYETHHCFEWKKQRLL